MLTTRPLFKSASPSTSLIIPELEHAKTAVLNALISVHSRRAYKHAMDEFIAWYCSEPRLGFTRAVMLRYRSFLESLSLSAATINLHLSAIRRLADEAAECSMLSPELAIGIRRVKGVKRLSRRLTRSGIGVAASFRRYFHKKSSRIPTLNFDFTGSDKVSLSRQSAFGYRSSHGRRPAKTYLTVCCFLDDPRNSFHLLGYLAVSRTIC